MVAFVPGFTSRKVAEYGAARRSQVSHLRAQFGNDSTAVTRELSAWDRDHPAPKATIADVADHIDHIRRVAGVDNVGLGSDFDGTGNDLPEGLQDVSTFPSLLAELARRGWSDADLRKVAGENVLRVMTQAERVAARLQKERPASTKTIEQLDGKGPKM